MSSCYGKNIKISIFGQSHSAAIGVVIDGLPAGHAVDMEKLEAFMLRRAPGTNEFSTSRHESDKVEVLSGLKNGLLCGAPFAAIIRNTDVRSDDYAEIVDTPRPGHADFTAQIKFGGYQDASGGGHFSGRMTAPLCIAGGIIMQLLAKENIMIGAHIAEIAGIKDSNFDPVTISSADLAALYKCSFAANDTSAGDAMKKAIADALSVGDSVGGIIECAAIGLPAGVGDHMFDGMENRIALAVFAIPAVKGIEFGSGFSGSKLCGSENNDAFTFSSSTVKTVTNNHGGILGGITSGMPLLFRVAIKPTPSIAQKQHTISFSQECDTILKIKGRHDPCIVPRAVPCVESAAAIAIYDALLDFKKYR